MDLSTLYWVLILPNIGNFLVGAGVISVIFCGAWVLVHAVSIDTTYNDEPKKEKLRESRNKVMKFIAAPALLFLIATFIPTSKQMMYLIGGYAATNVENIEKLPKNVVNAANKFLESYTDTEKKDK